jgi:hypothetical protein
MRVTLDTNVLDADKIARIHQAVEGLDVELAPTTVSVREHPESATPAGMVAETFVWGESSWGEGVWGPSPPVNETLTLGESRLGMAALGGDESPIRMEVILDVMTNRSFPKPGRREALTKGQRRQLRDAMILEAHSRDGREVLVSDDGDFVGWDGTVREKLEAFCGTRIMTVDEFCDYAFRLAAVR